MIPIPILFSGTKYFRYRYLFPVPNIFDTDTGTFSGTKFSRYRFRDFFPIPNFTDTGSETFFGTKFFRYRFRDFFPVPIFSDTGTDTTKKMKNSRYREFPVPIRHTLPSNHNKLCCAVSFENVFNIEY